MFNHSELESLLHNAINQIVRDTTSRLTETTGQPVVVFFAPIIVINTNVTLDSTTTISSDTLPLDIEAPHKPSSREIWGLTKQEARSLELLVAGYKNKEIAEKLSIGIQTVCNYLSTAYRKMGVTNALSAVLLWQQYQPEDSSES